LCLKPNSHQSLVGKPNQFLILAAKSLQFSCNNPRVTIEEIRTGAKNLETRKYSISGYRLAIVFKRDLPGFIIPNITPSDGTTLIAAHDAEAIDGALYPSLGQHISLTFNPRTTSTPRGDTGHRILVSDFDEKTYRADPLQRSLIAQVRGDRRPPIVIAWELWRKLPTKSVADAELYALAHAIREVKKELGEYEEIKHGSSNCCFTSHPSLLELVFYDLEQEAKAGTSFEEAKAKVRQKADDYFYGEKLDYLVRIFSECYLKLHPWPKINVICAA